MLEDDQFTEAHDLIRQSVRALENGFDNIVRKAQLVGQSIYDDELVKDANFWADCARQWGQGGGYRLRINDRNRQWFWGNRLNNSDVRVLELIEDNWAEAIAAVMSLLGAPTQDPVV